MRPMVMAQDLATSVELLSAVSKRSQSDRLGPSEAERLVASLDASFEALRRIGRHVRRGHQITIREEDRVESEDRPQTAGRRVP
jgi:hypothetical protein